METKLEKKVKQAIALLKAAGKFAGGQPVEISVSGGKDSDVILALARMAGINCKPIYKNTTIDPPGTIKHVMSQGATIIRPKVTFFQLIQRKGFPSRFARFCCSELKEYKVLDVAVQGIRRSESTRRAMRYKEPELCRLYPKKQKAHVFLPILEWEEEDIKQFVDYYNIKCHPIYYDQEGNFHPERRLGCMACPLATIHKRLDSFKQHPVMVREYIRNGAIYMSTHPDAKTAKRFTDPFSYFYANTFFRSLSKYYETTNSFYQAPNVKQLLEEYFQVNLDGIW